MLKKMMLSLLFIAAMNSYSFGQELDNAKKLGLVSYLTTVKAVSEFQMIKLAKSDQYKLQVAKAQDFQSNYNLIKLAVDRLVNQLEADLVVKNKLATYKAINRYITNGEALPAKLEAYKTVLEEIESLTATFMLKTYSSMAGASIADITGVVELVHTAVTDARDFREKKIQSLILILEKMKLEKLKDLTEQPKS